MRMELDEVLGWVEDVREQYEREQKQAILQRNMDRAITALAGQEACERLRNSIQMRYGMSQNIAMIRNGKKRA